MTTGIDSIRFKDTRLLSVEEVTDFIEGNVSKYITKWYKESDEKYQWRQNVTYYMDFINPVIKGLVGIIQQKPFIAEIKDEKYIKDIDMQNNTLNRFVSQVLTSAISQGVAFISTETTVKDNKSLADDKFSRIYLKHWKYNQVQSFRYNDYNQLEQIVFHERFFKNDGDYRTKEMDRYIKYFIGGGEIYEAEHGQEPKIITDLTWNNSLSYIPITIFHASLEGNGVIGEPLLKGLTKLNKSHLNMKSGVMNIVHIASNPVPVMYGNPLNQTDDNNNLSIGVNTILRFNSTEGNKFEYVEITGKSVEIATKDINELENYIIKSGFDILKQESRELTATEVILNNSKHKSILEVLVENCENAINTSLQYGKDMLKQDIGTIEMNRDFNNLMLDDKKIDTLLKLRDSGNLSLDTLWNSLKSVNMIPKNMDNTDEFNKIKDETEQGI